MRAILLNAVVVLALTVAACDEKPEKGAATAPSASTTASVAAAVAPPAEEPLTSSNAQAIEAYKLGVDMTDNARFDEAREPFQKALSLDPKFLSAMAMVGLVTPGPEGDKLLADAIAQGTALPEAERVGLLFAQAAHARDNLKAVEHAKKLTELLPRSWHAYFLYGRFLNLAGKPAETMAALKKAIENDPTAAAPYNDLAYAELGQGKTDDAITHLRKYAEMRPKEPNPQDSLGEALLMAGKYDDAEAAYKKAIELDSKFVGAWQGLGFTRLYKGDSSGAYEALGKLRDAATTVDNKGLAFSATAWGQLAQNKAADALKSIDAWDAEATKGKDEREAIFAAIHRAGILLDSGKAADSGKLLATVQDKIDKLQAPDALKTRMHLYARVIEVIGEGRTGKADDAGKALAAIQKLVGSSDEAEMKGMVALAQGEAALAKGDAKAAAQALQSCWALDDYCNWERSKAEEKAGDKTAAAATRDKLQKTHRRDPLSFFVWSRVAPGPEAKK